jgi:hypothetical protein
MTKDCSRQPNHRFTQCAIVQRISTEERAEDEARVRTVIKELRRPRAANGDRPQPGDGGAGADEADVRVNIREAADPGKPAGQELNRGGQTRAVGVVMEVTKRPNRHA